MVKKNTKKRPEPKKQPQNSVFQEAWTNMNNDMAKVMPDFLSKRLRDRKGKVWLMIVVTFAELVVFGLVGKFIYDWFMK